MVGLFAPVTEQQIIEAINSGALNESHRVEVKEQARNEQIAQTLASFAIDGGMFVIGIAERDDENGNKRLTLSPVALEGWLERVDGITRNTVDPPLPVQTTIIATESDPDTGYIVVSVPASPLAPHMVGGKYYGRGDASKHSLSDAEVRRHHERHLQQTNLGHELLDQAEAKDFLPLAERERGHIYMIAEPLSPPPLGSVEAFIHDEDAVRDFVIAGERACRPNLQGWFPSPSLALFIQHRELSVSAVSFEANGPGRTMNPDASEEGSLLDVEFTESGGIRVFVGRGTEDLHNSGETVILDGLAVAYTQRLVHWTGRLAEQYGYGSLWTLGFRMNRLAGLRSQVVAADYRHSRASGSLEGDVYSKVHTVSTDVALTDPDSVVRSLLHRFLKVLGSAADYEYD